MELNRERSSHDLQKCSLRLDVFIVRAHIGETNDQIDKRAAELAKAMAKMNGWREVSLTRSGLPSFVEGRYLCHFFEVWGLSSHVCRLSLTSHYLLSLEYEIF